jgi:hypothetical protein
MPPTLNLQNIKHEEVENEVERFLSLWLRKHLFTYFVVGDSETLSALVLKVVTAHGLEYNTGMPGYPGMIRVVMYDEFH